MAAMTLASQTQLFLLSFGFGFLLGIFYDVFRILRLTLTARPSAIFVQDVLYFLTCAFATFLFFLTVNDGEVRGYMLLGEVLGWIVYYFSFGAFAVRLSDAIVRAVKRLFRFLYRVISAPFRWIGRLMCKIGKRFGKNVKNKVKIYTKKSKFHLKREQALLYNLNGIFHRRTGMRQKETMKDAQTQEKE